MNTHYAVVSFSGDPMCEHGDPELCGRAPHLEFVACGPEDFCWEALARWTESHPLLEWQEAEVLTRDAALVSARSRP